jgi:serine/threonine-protein kinase
VRLARPLAQGAMGSLWEAKHARHGRCAVKFLAEQVAEKDQAALARFAREAEACARLESPHIARLYEHGVVDGTTPYIVMELLEGESLQQRLDRTGSLPLREVGRIVTHVARALSVAHAHGLVHRDVKPANIFLARAGDEEVVKLIDFGIALSRADRQERLTRPGVAMGSPEYMSPEQVTAGSPDASYDLWALAIVAYRAVTGRPPFTGKNVGQIFSSILEGELAPPSSHRPDLPPALDRWFMKALDRRAERRFKSAKDLARGFAEAAELVGKRRPRALYALYFAVAVAAGLLVGFLIAREMLR